MHYGSANTSPAVGQLGCFLLFVKSSSLGSVDVAWLTLYQVGFVSCLWLVRQRWSTPVNSSLEQDRNMNLLRTVWTASLTDNSLNNEGFLSLTQWVVSQRWAAGDIDPAVLWGHQDPGFLCCHSTLAFWHFILVLVFLMFKDGCFGSGHHVCIKTGRRKDWHQKAFFWSFLFDKKSKLSRKSSQQTSAYVPKLCHMAYSSCQEAGKVNLFSF